VLGWSYHLDLCGGGHAACPACHLEGVAAELARRFPFSGRWRLDAADYGVPQRRRRLILWAGPLPLDPDGPAPTHAHPEAAEDLGLRPWLTMGEAIGDTLHRGTCDRRACYPCDEEHGRACSEPWRLDRPAPTVTTAEEKGTRANAVADWSFNGGPDRASDAAFLVAGIRRIDLDEGLRLQGLPADWPLQGTVHQRYTQVGNAVPPRALAEAAGRARAGRAPRLGRCSSWGAAGVDGAELAHALRTGAAGGVSVRRATPGRVARMTCSCSHPVPAPGAEPEGHRPGPHRPRRPAPASWPASPRSARP
jgi:hypothetical protein